MRSGAARRRIGRQSGQTLIMFIFAVATLCGFVALAIDVGLIYEERREAQNAADAAALAGASGLPPTGSGSEAQSRAFAYAKKNGFENGSAGATVAVTWPYKGDTQKIEVTTARTISFVFGKVLGLGNTTISARAVGELPINLGGAASDASIITLNKTQCKSLEINASAAIRVEGAVMVNSSCNSFAGEISCSAVCQLAGGIETVGDVKTDSKCNPCVETTITPFEDPLKNVLPPCFTASPTPCENVGTLTVRHGTPTDPQPMKDPNFDFQPGIYYGGIEVGGNTKPWAPGVYVMAGGGFKLNTSTSFIAEGVFIYNTNDPSCPSCSNGGFKGVEINTSSSASFKPMTAGPYAGLLFFQDRTNTAKAVINPSASFGQGTMYFPNAHMDINPSANAHLQLIADTIKINNNASFTAGYSGNLFYQAPGTGDLRLVE